MFRRLITVFFIFISFSLFTKDSNSCGKIIVIIRGIKNNKGVINIGLYNSKKNFADDSSFFKGVRINVDSEEVQYTFNNITHGEYAIAVYHDINEDMKHNKNLLGIPTENYGFSNNAFGLMGTPDYDGAKFILTHGEIKSFTINLR